MTQSLSEIILKGEFVPLKAHASTKKFYVGKWEGKKSLLIDFEGGKDERDSFYRLTQILLKNEISVPQIIYLPQGDYSFLVTEFANGNLISKSGCREKVFELILSQAEKFSLIKEDSLKNLNILTLGLKRIIYELDFFILHFCEVFANQNVGEEIRREIHLFAEEIDSFPKSFCHRDYHSENIVSDGENVFILDYQDALMAPRTYDYASLYVDGYFDFPESARQSVKNRALKIFNATEGEFLKTALQRALKALGTFGFQIVYRKKVRYVTSVKRTVSYLNELLGEKVVKSENLKDYLLFLQKRVTSELCG